MCSVQLLLVGRVCSVQLLLVGRVCSVQLLLVGEGVITHSKVRGTAAGRHYERHPLHLTASWYVDTFHILTLRERCSRNERCAARLMFYS